jgi:GNAT superfamily N-acetyltransferase
MEVLLSLFDSRSEPKILWLILKQLYSHNTKRKLHISNQHSMSPANYLDYADGQNQGGGWMKMDVAIRDFVEGDREEYMRMSELFFESDAVLHRSPKENAARSFEECLLGNPYLRGLMLESEMKAVGYALLSLTWSNEAGGMCVLLEEAYVLPDFRGEGIGGDLMRFVEKEYRSRARRFRLEVARSNAGAIRLYERMGYKELDYIQMVKDI